MTGTSAFTSGQVRLTLSCFNQTGFEPGIPRPADVDAPVVADVDGLGRVDAEFLDALLKGHRMGLGRNVVSPATP